MYLIVNEEIINYLKSKDEDFIHLQQKYGLIKLKLNTDIFDSIVFHIVGQMLSLKAANSIYKRLKKICGGEINPISLIELDREQIRECGIAYSKVDYIKEFAKNYNNNMYDFKELENMEDQQVIKYLMNIKGVGQWTAEMLAMFTFGRKNIFSYNDVALRNGIIKMKGFKTLSKKRFEGLRKKYSPYCSYAALYFYSINDDKSK